MTSAVDTSGHDVIDFEVLAGLCADRSVYNLEGVARACGVTKQSPTEWYMRTLAWLDEHPKAPRAQMPLRDDMLPIPDHPNSVGPKWGPRDARGGGRGSQPLWYASTIHRWALDVMRMHPDGTGRYRPLPGQPARQPERDLSPITIDFDRVRELQSSTDKLSAKEAAELLGLEYQTLRLLVSHTRAYLEEHPLAEGEPLVRTEWNSRPLAPLHDHPESTAHRPLWKRGTIIRFGMFAEYIDLHGQTQRRPRLGGARGRVIGKKHPNPTGQF